MDAHQSQQVTMRFIVTACLLLSVSLVGLTKAQGIGYDCCSIYMMDTRGAVAIETRRQLTTGNFVALKVRACTTDPVSVQIWRRVNDSTFQFRWQTVITPTLSQTTRTYITVSFNSTVTITSEDRLGLFSPVNSSKLAIPYGFDDDDLFYLYYSKVSFNSFADFSSTVQITTDDLRWPRSFNGSIFFCQLPGCSDQSQDVPVSSSPYTTTPRSGVTPAGQCCPNQMSCDPTGIFGPILNQSKNIENLNKQVNDINELIKNLLSTQKVTGICPQGFSSGSFGVDKCYIVIRDLVPMAVAALRCRTDYPNAPDTSLVQIRNIQQDTFLKKLLLEGATSVTQSSWTAGMYDRVTSNWFWYDESTRTKTPLTGYTNWQNQTQPVPTTDEDVCSNLVVVQGPSNSTSYWVKTNCHETNYFICQTPKQCF